MNKFTYFYMCILLSLFFAITLSLITFSFANSPTFSEQQIRDDKRDWVNMKTRQANHSEFKVPDITSVNYFSDGGSLNVTLWLSRVFKEPSRLYKEVDYGMFIDSDFNNKTGFGGIDYKIEIRWSNDTNLWTKKIERYGYYDTNVKTIENIKNYTDFYEKNGNESYVTLDVDLNKILNPTRYKVIFYADSRKSNDDLIMDYTSYIAIPQLQLTPYTIPSSVDLTQGEKKNIIVRLNSTEGYAPIVNLKAEVPDKKIVPIFESTGKSYLTNFRLPTNGIGIIPLTIDSTVDARLGPSFLLITANSSFPRDDLLKIGGVQSVFPDNVNSKSIVSLSVTEAPGPLDRLSEIWSKVGDFATFVYGIVIGISPFLYTLIKKYFFKEGKPT
jgi:hypothetical protein